jgi:hypothetical protein
VAETEGAGNQARAKPAAPAAKQWTCFVVSAFGKSPEDKRARSQVLKHLIKKVLEPRGYEVERADQISEEGLITHQIIEHLLDDDLVVADLTGHNPNVFYEIAVRHAARKPIVHLITKDESIPFDVGNQRAVSYALDDPDVLETAQDDLERKVEAIEGAGFKAFSNPITSVRDVAILRESGQPEAQDSASILMAVNELRQEMQVLQRQVRRSAARPQELRQTAAQRAVVASRIREVLRETGGPMTPGALSRAVEVPVPIVQQALLHLADADEVAPGDGGWRLRE